MSKRKEKYKEFIDCVEFSTDKLAAAGDYIYLPYPYLKNYVNAITGIINERFIKSEDFTVEKIKEIFDFEPRALMGGVIQDFQDKHIPKFLQHLKEDMPDKYNEFIKTYPQISAEAETISSNYIGRKAYINTLNIGAVIPHRKGEFIYDGKFLVCGDYNDTFMPFGNRGAYVRIKVTDNMTTEISDNAQVNEKTKFIN